MFKKLFVKRIGFRVDDQIKAMNEEILKVKSEYKARLIKPKKFMNFKRRFHKGNTTTNDIETVSNDNIEIDEYKITEEKKGKVKKNELI